ncbi:MAG TPA: hypothetical protein PK765_00600 [bacterium]|nr:hypothetical protein [bacterium]
MRIRSILILVSCAVLATPASAHPLDISATTATVKTDGVSLVTFLHSYEAELLMNRAGVLLS